MDGTGSRRLHSMKSVILSGFRTTVESPRKHFPDAELWGQSTSARSWDWTLYDWSRWFDIHTVGPQSYYPGIRIQRPDVLNWYMKQGRERPIYLTETHPDIMGSVAYPLADMEAVFDPGYFGCQLDYMAALALHEGFDRWILYSIGAPYVGDPTSERAQKWFKFHRTFIHWLRLALDRGVEIVLDGPNMFTADVVNDPGIVIEPHVGRYGYDMSVVDRTHILSEQTEHHPFHRD